MDIETGAVAVVVAVVALVLGIVRWCCVMCDVSASVSCVVLCRVRRVYCVCCIILRVPHRAACRKQQICLT